MVSSPITSQQIDGKNSVFLRKPQQWQILFSWAPKSWWTVSAAMKLKDAYSLEEKAMTNLDSVLKKQRHHFAYKGPSSQSYGFSNNHVWMWELNHKEGGVPKNWSFWTVVLEKMLEGPLTQGGQTSQS